MVYHYKSLIEYNKIFTKQRHANNICRLNILHHLRLINTPLIPNR